VISDGRGPRRGHPRFFADAMLGSLARKLRIFGFDTLYFNEGDDAEFERLAEEEGRIIITSDKALLRHAEGVGLRCVSVGGRTDKSRLLSVAEQLGPEAFLQTFGKAASRCALCNGVLEEFGRKDAAATALPAKVVSNHRKFFRCASCSRFYWRGRHWEKLRRLSASLRKDLTSTT
jgi:uncharacterized protein with PIN domain